MAPGIYIINIINILIIFLHIKVRVGQGATKGLVMSIEGFETSVIWVSKWTPKNVHFWQIPDSKVQFSHV